MIRRPTHYPCKDERADLFTLSLLLAEGQIGTGCERWPAFIDRLASITDALATARADETTHEGSRQVLVSA